MGDVDLPLKLVRRGGGGSPSAGFPIPEEDWEFMGNGEPMIDHVGLGSRSECRVCPVGVGAGETLPATFLEAP